METLLDTVSDVALCVALMSLPVFLGIGAVAAQDAASFLYRRWKSL